MKVLLLLVLITNPFLICHATQDDEFVSAVYPATVPDPNDFIGSVSQALYIIFQASAVAVKKSVDELQNDAEYTANGIEYGVKDTVAESEILIRELFSYMNDGVNEATTDFKKLVGNLDALYDQIISEGADASNDAVKATMQIWKNVRNDAKKLKRFIRKSRDDVSRELNALKEKFGEESAEFKEESTKIYQNAIKNMLIATQMVSESFTEALSLPEKAYYDIDMDALYLEWIKFLNMIEGQPREIINDIQRNFNTMYFAINIKFFLTLQSIPEELWPYAAHIWLDANNAKDFVNSGLTKLNSYARYSTNYIKKQYANDLDLLQKEMQAFIWQTKGEFQILLDFTEIPFEKLYNLSESTICFQANIGNDRYDYNLDRLANFLKEQGYTIYWDSNHNFVPHWMENTSYQLRETENVQSQNFENGISMSYNGVMFLDLMNSEGQNLEYYIKQTRKTLEEIKLSQGNIYSLIVHERTLKDLKHINRIRFKNLRQIIPKTDTYGKIILYKFYKDSIVFEQGVNFLLLYVSRSALLLNSTLPISSKEYKDAIHMLYVDVKQRLNILATFFYVSYLRSSDYKYISPNLTQIYPTDEGINGPGSKNTDEIVPSQTVIQSSCTSEQDTIQGYQNQILPEQPLILPSVNNNNIRSVDTESKFVESSTLVLPSGYPSQLPIGNSNLLQNPLINLNTLPEQPPILPYINNDNVPNVRSINSESKLEESSVVIQEGYQNQFPPLNILSEQPLILPNVNNNNIRSVDTESKFVESSSLVLPTGYPSQLPIGNSNLLQNPLINLNTLPEQPPILPYVNNDNVRSFESESKLEESSMVIQERYQNQSPILNILPDQPPILPSVNNIRSVDTELKLEESSSLVMPSGYPSQLPIGNSNLLQNPLINLNTLPEQPPILPYNDNVPNVRSINSESKLEESSMVIQEGYQNQSPILNILPEQPPILPSVNSIRSVDTESKLEESSSLVIPSGYPSQLPIGNSNLLQNPLINLSALPEQPPILPSANSIRSVDTESKLEESSSLVMPSGYPSQLPMGNSNLLQNPLINISNLPEQPPILPYINNDNIPNVRSINSESKLEESSMVIQEGYQNQSPILNILPEQPLILPSENNNNILSVDTESKLEESSSLILPSGYPNQLQIGNNNEEFDAQILRNTLSNLNIPPPENAQFLPNINNNSIRSVDSKSKFVESSSLVLPSEDQNPVPITGNGMLDTLTNLNMSIQKDDIMSNKNDVLVEMKNAEKAVENNSLIGGELEEIHFNQSQGSGNGIIETESEEDGIVHTHKVMKNVEKESHIMAEDTNYDGKMDGITEVGTTTVTTKILDMFSYVDNDDISSQEG